MIILPKDKKIMSKHDLMLIIFICRVYKICLIVLLPNLKRTEDHIDKIIRALY